MASPTPTPTSPPTGRSGPPAPDPVVQEVRLAMALNGGVSLAVWMGGCAVELDCARRARWGDDEPPKDGVGRGSKRTVYSSLCNAFERELVIDIMSGASAGGVNGGLLAAAMRFERRLDPKYIRDQWLELGDFSRLLHTSADKSPHSLLQGKLFVDSLLAVFEDLEAEGGPSEDNGLAVPGSQAANSEESIPHLDVTVTDVRGTDRNYSDEWDGTFSAREYRRRFRFRHRNDFNPAALAEAARCSASFPAAFEPYRPDGDSWRLTDQPDLQKSGEGPPWTIDGGLLDNAPIRAAIEQIPNQSATRQVKRYLVYVNPEPAVSLEPGTTVHGTNADGQTPSGEPGLANVAGYVVNLPRKLPFVDQLDAIGDAVQKSSLVSSGTVDLLRTPLPVMQGVAFALLPTYSSRRRLKSLQELLGDPAAVERAARALDEAGVELPWIPTRRALRDPDPWEWGLSAAIRGCHFLLDLLRMEIREEPDRQRRAQLLNGRIQLDEPLAELQAAYAGGEQSADLIDELRSSGSSLSARQLAGLRGLAGDQQSVALPALRTAICAFADLLIELEGLRLESDDESEIDVGAALFGAEWQFDEVFASVRRLDPRAREGVELTEPELLCLRRLLAIEVIRRAFTAEEPVDSEQRLNFVQLTPDAPTPILSKRDGPYPASAESKLTGIRLGHFAGFLKQSWRANDFMWGRLDAAARMVDLLVDPVRAQELGPDLVADELVRGLLGEDPTLEQRWLASELLVEMGDGVTEADLADVDDLRQELHERISADLGEPGGLAVFTRMACTRGAQLEILRAELPAIAIASREDAGDGSAIQALDFGRADEGTGDLPQEVLRDAIVNVRDGKPLPERLGRDDPAETTSDLTATIAAHAGFVTLAALGTAKLPGAPVLNLLRPPFLAVTGMAARNVLLRIALVLGFWAASLYLAARIVGTDAGEPADLGAIAFNEFLLALVAILSVIGVAILPSVRGLRRRSEPVAVGEFAAAFFILAFGGGAAIVAALGFGGLTLGKLIVANGFEEPPDWVLTPALFILLGVPIAGPAIVRWTQDWVADLSKHVAVMAVLLGVVSGVIGVWMGIDLVDVTRNGAVWEKLAAWIALLGPVLVSVPYLILHSIHRGHAAA